MLVFNVYDFDSYSCYKPSKEQEEDGASSNRRIRILYIPHKRPPIRWDHFVLCTSDLHDEMTLSGVRYKFVGWGIVEEHRMQILDLITGYLDAAEVDTRENARLIPFHIDINRLVAFWTNSDQSSGELDPSRNGAISALDQI